MDVPLAQQCDTSVSAPCERARQDPPADDPRARLNRARRVKLKALTMCGQRHPDPQASTMLTARLETFSFFLSRLLQFADRGVLQACPTAPLTAASVTITADVSRNICFTVSSQFSFFCTPQPVGLRTRRLRISMRQIDAVWISNEVPSVFPKLAKASPPPAPDQSLLAVDAKPVAWTGPHGQSITWFAT
jgi:hypothetical protein